MAYPAVRIKVVAVSAFINVARKRGADFGAGIRAGRVPEIGVGEAEIVAELMGNDVRVARLHPGSPRAQVATSTRKPRHRRMPDHIEVVIGVVVSSEQRRRPRVRQERLSPAFREVGFGLG